MTYKTSDVLRLCNISKPTLYKICKAKNIKVGRTIGGNYRYSEKDVQAILGENIDTQSVERRFISTINDVWEVLTNMATEIWGKQGEQKLKDILNKNKNEIFLLNISEFK